MDEIFVGRGTELAFLHGRLDEVRGGLARVVLVDGDAGVGKTALLRQLLAGADGCRCLRASGDELEAGLAYGVVEQLLAGVGRRLADLPAGGGDPGPLGIGSGLLELLGQLQAASPVLVVIDDAHFTDAASLEALAFAVRRLRADRVLALLSVHDDDAGRLSPSLHRLVASPVGSRLRLRGLDVDELRQLGVALGRGVLSHEAAARLRDHTAGNPLHARALLEELPPEAFQRNGQPLPAPRSFRMLVLARLAVCPSDARRLVVAAAVLGTRCPLALASRLAEVENPLLALEQAIRARLLAEHTTATERLVAFTHPLVRAAVYHDLGPARRAALHARAARLAESEPSAVHHQAAAVIPPNGALAGEVAALAAKQTAAQAWAAAADSLLAAARLAASRAEREGYVLQAVDRLLLGGQLTEALGFAPEVAGFADGPSRNHLLGRLAMLEGRPADAEELLARAWDQGLADTDPSLAAAVAEQLAIDGILRARGGQALTWARRALAHAPADPPASSNRLDTLTIAAVLGTRGDETMRLTAATEQRGPPSGPGGLDGWVGRGIAELWADDLTAARRDLGAVVAADQHRGPPRPWGLVAMVMLAETEYRLGAWDDAILHAERAVSIARESGLRCLHPLAHAVAAFPLAARGEREAAETHVAMAAHHLRVEEATTSAVWAAMAGALVALADGDGPAVATALEPLLRLVEGTAILQPGWPPWPSLLLDALIGEGRYDEAEPWLGRLEAAAATSGHRSSAMAAARTRGVLEAARGRPAQAEAAFRSGLRHAAGLPMPFERALLEAAYGRFLSRAGRRDEAAAQLEAACRRLAELGARPYQARCERDLAACSRTQAWRPAGPRGTLTPQELAVARVVAAGRTNREAAAELVVSVKTIEYHLGNAYAKLSVTSRTQLALRLKDWGNP